VSPIRAKVFLHDGLDVWVAKVVKRHWRGEVCLIRYADDFVCAFEDQAEAERVDNVLGQRRETCGRARSGAKTRILPFRQRHRYTWPGYKAVLERCTGARPRIVGRPKTRQATLKTEADLRQRVFRKSPVREHRTPGSGRGPSGNRRSYRDGEQPTKRRI
jgi:hypothetical protein